MGSSFDKIMAVREAERKFLTTAKKTGPTIKDLWTPGFHSSDPSTWPSQKAAQEAKARKESAEMLEELEKVKMEKIKGLAMTMVVVDEEAVAVSPQEELAVQMAAHYASNTTTFMLVEPVSVTIKKSDGKFGKRAMIGGETFRPVDCYVGKRKSLIHVFKPLQASDYATAELSHEDAKKLFGHTFTEFIKAVDGGKFEEMNREANKLARDEEERIKNAGKAEQYSDLGFGSW